MDAIKLEQTAREALELVAKGKEIWHPDIIKGLAQGCLDLLAEKELKEEIGCCNVEHGWRIFAEKQVKELKAENEKCKEAIMSYSAMLNDSVVDQKKLQADRTKLVEKIDKLKRLMLLTDPVVENEVMNDIAIRQFSEFIKCYPDESSDPDTITRAALAEVGEV